MAEQKKQLLEEKKLDERVLIIRRVSKKTSGGNYVTFSALVAVGDGNGRVGVGMGRAVEVPPAIRKAVSYARKHMIDVPRYNTTIPHQIITTYKSGKLILKPAPVGTGLKVGSVVRTLLELAGIKDVSGKIIGTRNQVANTYTVMKALKSLKQKDKGQVDEQVVANS